MSLLIPALAALCSALAVWLVRGAIALQSAAPGAPKVGVVPPVWELGALLAAALALVFLLRPSRDRVMPLFATALCIAPWLPGIRTPALLAWTGPLGAAVLLAAAAAVAALWIRDRRWTPTAGALVDPRRAPFTAALIAFAVFSLVGFGARAMVPGGDEPHYLIITQSLLEDHDLQIENNHKQRDYAAYFDGDLKPDYYRRGQNGKIYSVHAPGLPVLIAPAFAIAGYRGAVVFLLLGAALTMALAWHVSYLLTRSAAASWFGVAAMTFATPIAFHTFTIYPDTLAGGFVLTGIWALLRLVPTLGAPPGRTRTWVWHGAALAVLPWIHTRFALLSGCLAIVVLLRMPRTREGFAHALAFVAVPLVSAIGWFTFFYVIYGTPSPDAPYGTFMKSQSSLAFVSGGLAGLFFDQQFGILVYAPVFVVAFAGYLVMARRWPRLALEIAIVSIPYFIAITNLRMWWAGWSAPARFAVPALLQGSFLCAIAWQAARTRAARATATGTVLVSAFTTLALAFVQGGRLAYNVRDGYSLWLEWLSPLADLPLGLPSFFRWLQAEPAMDLQMLFAVAVFVTAFAAVRAMDRRARLGAGSVLLLLLAANAIAGMVMLGVLWKANSATGVRPTASELALLRAAAALDGSGVVYERGMRAVATSSAVASLRIESPPRMAVAGDAPALAIPGWIPGGDYTIALAAADPAAASTFEVRTMRLDRPIADGRFEHSARVPLSLPVDVPAILVRGENVGRGSLEVSRVARDAGLMAGARATTAQRYGETICWFLDRNLFVEQDGFWVRGAQTADVVFQPLSAAARQLVLSGHNGAAPNHLRFESDKWHEEKALAPGQSFEIAVPLETAGAACRLRITTSAGFRPSEVERGSADQRHLGAWIVPGNAR